MVRGRGKVRKKVAIRRGIRVRQVSKGLFICDLDGKEFHRKSALKKHFIAAHLPKRFVCLKCGYPSATSWCLERHQVSCALDNANSNKQKPHRCPICFKGFTRKDPMLRHVKQIHEGVNDTVTCELCGLELKYSRLLPSHQRGNCSEQGEGLIRNQAYEAKRQELEAFYGPAAPWDVSSVKPDSAMMFHATQDEVEEVLTREMTNYVKTATNLIYVGPNISKKGYPGTTLNDSHVRIHRLFALRRWGHTVLLKKGFEVSHCNNNKLDLSHLTVERWQYNQGRHQCQLHARCICPTFHQPNCFFTKAQVYAKIIEYIVDDNPEDRVELNILVGIFNQFE